MLILALGWSASAQDINLGIVSETLIGGYNYVVKHNGNYAFIATGHGVKIFECSDPVNPTLVTDFPTNGIAINLSVQGNYLFVCDTPNGLLCYDISDIFNPILVGELTLEGSIRSVTAYGDYLYACMESMGLYIIDWSDPTDMQLLNTIFVGGECGNADIFDNYLYLTLGVAGMAVYDITDPLNPEYSLIWNVTGGRCTDAYVFGSEDVMALTDGWNGIHMLDLQYPWIPTWYATLEVDSTIAGWLDGKDDWGVASFFANGMQTFDLDGDMLDEVLNDFCTGVDIYDDYIYLCYADSGFGIYNCTDPGNLTLENSILNTRLVIGTIMYDDYLYVSNYADGLRIFDLSDPAVPELINTVSTGRWTFSMNFPEDDHYIYVADYLTGINIFDATDPTNPILVNTVSPQPDTGCVGVAFYDDLMYAIVNDRAFNVFDASNRENPVLTWAPEDTLWDLRGLIITNDGQNLITSSWEHGFTIWSVDSPTNIVEEYQTDIVESIVSMRQDGNTLYVSDWDGWVWVLDISNPYYIFKRDSLQFDDVGNSLQLFEEDHLVVSDNGAGIKMVNIADPDNIFLVDEHDTYSFAGSSKPNGNYLYLADQYSLLTFDIYSPPGVRDDDPVNIPNDLALLHPAYPNPFNPTTTLSFSLAKPGHTKISLYNVAGEKITDLYDDFAKAGNHKFSFDAKGLASGMYFVTMEAHKVKQTQKILYVK